MLKGRTGYTLIEAMLVLGIMGFIGAGALALIVASFTCFEGASTESFTDTDAVLAMQAIVNDVREAKNVNILANGTRLRVVFPKVTDEGYYDRHEPDMANQIDYYLSDSTGVPGHSGDWLWRGKNNGNRKPIKKGIVALEFEQDTSRSVKITITARNEAVSGPKETRLTQRVVYLRNY
ncbi:MAG: type II secretion system protein [Armatimonadota bacterium]|nr:type II secretion system protein [Armatimonadota bacterium]